MMGGSIDYTLDGAGFSTETTALLLQQQPIPLVSITNTVLFCLQTITGKRYTFQLIAIRNYIATLQATFA
jgi:hypothetical protein